MIFCIASARIIELQRFVNVFLSQIQTRYLDLPRRGADALVFSEAVEANGGLVFTTACELCLDGCLEPLRRRLLIRPCRNGLRVKNPDFQRRRSMYSGGLHWLS